MKNLNILMVALACVALPAAAFGQTVTCDTCTHDVSVFTGSGGLIANTDADEVTWVATCGGLTVSGELEPDSDGMVSMLFNDENGLACDKEESRLQIGPVSDGGWFWITEDTNSGVGNLVSQDVLENKAVEVTNPGTGVAMRKGRGAVLLRQTATGRVGILPDILPTPEVEVTKCGHHWNASRERIDQRGAADLGNSTAATETCMLDASFSILMETGSGATAGGRVTNGAVRRNHTGALIVDVSLWGEGFVDTAPPTGDGFDYVYRGVQQGRPLLTDESRGTPEGQGWTVSLSGTGVFGAAVGDAGITLGPDDDTDPRPGVVRLTIGDASNDGETVSGGYCTSTRSAVATLSIKANPGANAITPGIPDDWRAFGLPDLRPSTTLKVMCPASNAANQGQELVPDNPFPTEE